MTQGSVEIDSQGDLHLAHRLADAADAISLSRYHSLDLVVETKPDATPVTDADRAVEKEIRALLQSERPHHLIIGEEFGGKELLDSAKPGTKFWIIDPIDGTKSFISGVPLYSTLVGLTCRGQPLLGVIAIPALGELVLGATGCGAWYGQRGTEPGSDDPVVLARCRVSSVETLSDGLFLTSQVDNFERRGAEDAYKSLQESAYVSRSWGDGYGYLLVATGRAELMVDPVVNPWDVAAVAPVVIEAGGKFTSWSGQIDLRAGHCLASNGLVHEEALRTLVPYADL